MPGPPGWQLGGRIHAFDALLEAVEETEPEAFALVEAAAPPPELPVLEERLAELFMPEAPDAVV